VVVGKPSPFLTHCRGTLTFFAVDSPQTGLTSSEQLAQDAEQDGTAFGADKAEEKRLKDEKWAQFTDANPKGAGNTMNRG
jgi:immunoglobulin-binding protein 1